MVATLVLIRDENGDMHDPEGHLRNAAGQRLDDQGAIISDPEAVVLEAGNAAANSYDAFAENTQAARHRTL